MATYDLEQDRRELERGLREEEKRAFMQSHLVLVKSCIILNVCFYLHSSLNMDPTCEYSHSKYSIAWLIQSTLKIWIHVLFNIRSL